jgi:ABC-type nitrate/sulfonate/bicarbonate transport system ATPase subunit
MAETSPDVRRAILQEPPGPKREDPAMSSAPILDVAARERRELARPKVALRGVSMVFNPHGKAVRVLDDIDLDVDEGEFLCLLGPSGCGKSTLLNIVGGFLRPTSGDVRIDGEVVRGPDPRRIYVFQERGVFPWLTVTDNIGFGLGHLDRAERQRRIKHYIDLVGLQGFEASYPHELSGGMKQRVEVARALAVNPDVLYLDEPFGALDSITRLTMRAELLRIWAAERKTIIFVTHDIEESIQLADRVVIMTARPAKMRRVVPIDVPRPRDLSSPRYIALRELVFDELGLAHRI